MDRREYLLATGSIAVGLLGGCIGTDTTQSGPEDQSDPRQWHGNYGGTAQVTTFNINYSGDRISTYSQFGSYEKSVTATIQDPYASRVNKELNPVNLDVDPDINSAQGRSAGDFFIASAGEIVTEGHPEPSILQPWNLQIRENTLSGGIDHDLPSGSNYFLEGNPGTDTSTTEISNVAVPWEYLARTTLTAQLTETGISMEVAPPTEGTTIDRGEQMALTASIACELTRQ